MTDIERRPNRVLGAEHDQFWEYCNEGELRIQRCRTCGHLSWPPVQACERCGRAELDWKAVSGRGTVVSWSTFEQPYFEDLLPVPWETILVELEEGVMFISNPHGFSVGDAWPGMPLTVAFIECCDDQGAYQLPVFDRAQS